MKAEDKQRKINFLEMMRDDAHKRGKYEEEDEWRKSLEEALKEKEIKVYLSEEDYESFKREMERYEKSIAGNYFCRDEENEDFLIKLSIKYGQKPDFFIFNEPANEKL